MKRFMVEFKADGGFYTKVLEADTADDAVACARYQWLSYLAASGGADPESFFEKYYSLSRVVEV